MELAGSPLTPVQQALVEEVNVLFQMTSSWERDARVVRAIEDLAHSLPRPFNTVGGLLRGVGLQLGKAGLNLSYSSYKNMKKNIKEVRGHIISHYHPHHMPPSITMQRRKNHPFHPNSMPSSCLLQPPRQITFPPFSHHHRQHNHHHPPHHHPTTLWR